MKPHVSLSIALYNLLYISLTYSKPWFLIEGAFVLSLQFKHFPEHGLEFSQCSAVPAQMLTALTIGSAYLTKVKLI